MRSICLLLVFSAIFHQGLNAQKKWLFGIKGGISIPNLRAPKDDGSFSGGYKTVLGPEAGVIAEYKLSPLFSLKTEFNYSTQGGEKKGNQRLNTKGFEYFFPIGSTIPDYLYARFDNRIKLVYLELPVLAKFSFTVAAKTRLSLMAGPYIGSLVKAENTSSGKSKMYKDAAYTQEYDPYVFNFNRQEDVLDQLNRTNYGIQGGLTLGYNLRKFELFFAAGGTHGLRDLQKDKKFGDNKTGGATISLGALMSL